MGLVLLAYAIMPLFFILVGIFGLFNLVLVADRRHYFVQLFRRVLAMNVDTAVVQIDSRILLCLGGVKLLLRVWVFSFFGCC